MAEVSAGVEAQAEGGMLRVSRRRRLARSTGACDRFERMRKIGARRTRRMRRTERRAFACPSCSSCSRPSVSSTTHQAVSAKVRATASGVMTSSWFLRSGLDAIRRPIESVTDTAFRIYLDG